MLHLNKWVKYTDLKRVCMQLTIWNEDNIWPDIDSYVNSILPEIKRKKD